MGGEIAGPNGEVAGPNGEAAGPNGEVAGPNGEVAGPNTQELVSLAFENGINFFDISEPFTSKKAEVHLPIK